MDCPKVEDESDGISIKNIGGVFLVIFIGIGLGLVTLGFEYYWCVRLLSLIVYSGYAVFFFRVLHTMSCHFRAHTFARSVTVMRYSGEQGSICAKVVV